MNTSEARAAAKFAAVLQRDKQGRVRSVIVPGHEGKQYQVIIRREFSTGISVECLLSTNAGHVAQCAGNSHSICYHALAALIKAVGDRRILFSVNNAKRVARLMPNSKVVLIESRQSHTRAYMIVAGEKSNAVE